MDTELTPEQQAQQDQELALFRTHVRIEATEEQVTRLRDNFISGQLSHAGFSALSPVLQTMYKATHGYRPATESEIAGMSRAKQARKDSKKREKQARKLARRS